VCKEIGKKFITYDQSLVSSSLAPPCAAVNAFMANGLRSPLGAGRDVAPLGRRGKQKKSVPSERKNRSGVIAESVCAGVMPRSSVAETGLAVHGASSFIMR
jgi:hypothetical protein